MGSVVGVEQSDDVESEITLQPDDITLRSMEDLQHRPSVSHSIDTDELEPTLIQVGLAKNSFNPSKASLTAGSKTSTT